MTTLSEISGKDGIVPWTGPSLWLVAFTALAMVFLTVIAMAFSLAANRAAADWTSSVAQAMTIRIAGPPDTLDAGEAAVMRVLETTSGIGEVTVVEPLEQEAILEPWLGADVSLDAFDLPRLIAVTRDGDGPDVEGLRLRLEAEVPAAELTDHAGWQSPLIDASMRVAWLGTAAALLALATLVAVIMLSAHAAIAAHRDIVATLRLLGARDAFIAKAFVRHLTVLAAIGAAIGAVAGVVTVALQPGGGTGSGLFTTLRFQGMEWVVPFLLVPFAAALAFIAAKLTARAVLNRLA